jgi:tRNA pseudouridine38-40 synthase
MILNFILDSFQNFYRTAFTSFAEEMDQIIDEQKSLRKDQAAKRLDKRKAKQERYNGKIKKRDWVQETEEERKIRLEKLAESGEVFERIKRKKAAVLLGYSGVNYYGMQKNPFVPTIEDEILKAMVKHKWITEDCYEQPQNAGFQRCARTDKGVSAARQLISLKIPDEVNIEEINKDLPEDIRIFGTFKVTKGFNAKSNCDARSYSYTLPTYTFLNEDSDEVEKSMYRMSAEKIEELNKILAIYEGTKNYHNFTLKKEAWDPSAKR